LTALTPSVCSSFSQQAVTPEQFITLWPKQRFDVGKILSRQSRRKTHNEACKRENQVYERINKFWSTMEKIHR